MSTETTIATITSITTIISPVISWFLAKKKYSAEVDDRVIANMRESLDFYKRLSDDNKQRLDDVLLRNAKLEQEIAELRQQVMRLSMIVASYGLQEKITNDSDEDIKDDNKEPSPEDH